MLRAGIGALLAAGGAAGVFATRPAVQAVTLGDACHTPARVLEPARGAANGGAAVVFHGLSSNAGIMQPLGQALAGAGWRVYLLDLPGHGRSGEAFSFAAVDRCAASAVEWLEKTGRIEPQRAIFVGHSLGAAAAVRLADRDPVAATVAISPAPLVRPRREPANLLVLAARFDIGAVKAAARDLLRAAGGPRDSPADFAQRRAARLRIVGGEAHGTMVLDPRVWCRVLEWGGEAIGARISRADAAHHAGLARTAMICNLLLLAGLVLLVAPVERALAIGVSMRESGAGAGSGAGESGDGSMTWRGTLGRWAVAAFFSAAILGLLDAARYVKPVRLEDGDWAALAALLTGLVLIALCRPAVRGAFRFQARELTLALICGAAVLAVFVAALDLDLGEMVFSSARIWRLAVLVAFTWPYFLAEEAALGPPAGRRRFGLFLALRATVWLAQLFVLLVFWHAGLILALLFAALGAVSIGQRLAADVLRNSGASPTAAAFFDAILAAGTLALILPLI